MKRKNWKKTKKLKNKPRPALHSGPEAPKFGGFCSSESKFPIRDGVFLGHKFSGFLVGFLVVF